MQETDQIFQDIERQSEAAMLTANSAGVQFISDDSDFCRKCRGKGLLTEKTERNATMYMDCWDCGGSGRKSVAVTSPSGTDQ